MVSSQDDVDDFEYFKHKLNKAFRFPDIPEIEINVAAGPKPGDVMQSSIDIGNVVVNVGDLVEYVGKPMVFLGKVWERNVHSFSKSYYWHCYLLAADGIVVTRGERGFELVSKMVS